MTKTLYFVLLITLCSCQKQYFEFDKIEHYHVNKMYDKEEMDETEYKAYDLLNDDVVPKMDEHFANELKPFYYLKSIIPSKQNSKIAEIYKTKIVGRMSASRCLPVFRDILVFKKNDQITGVSKLCFDCEMDITLDKFRARNEIDMDNYDKLEKILNE